MVYDERTVRTLREISIKKNVTDDDMYFVKEAAKQREELFKRANPNADYEKLVNAVAHDELGNAIHRIMEAVEQKLRAMETGEKIMQEDIAKSSREHEETSELLETQGVNPKTAITHAGMLPIEKAAEALGIDKELLQRHINTYKTYEAKLDEYYEHTKRYEEILNELAEIFREAPLMYHVYKKRKNGDLHEDIEKAFQWALETMHYNAVKKV